MLRLRQTVLTAEVVRTTSLTRETNETVALTQGTASSTQPSTRLPDPLVRDGPARSLKELRTVTQERPCATRAIPTQLSRTPPTCTLAAPRSDQSAMARKCGPFLWIGDVQKGL